MNFLAPVAAENLAAIDAFVFAVTRRRSEGARREDRRGGLPQ
jgi:hypothetical protein